MATNEQERALCEYLDDIRLGGHWWIVGSDEPLLEGLSFRFPDNVLHSSDHMPPDALNECSVLILSISTTASTEAVLTQLARTPARPVIVLLGNTELSESEQSWLHVLGYSLPPKRSTGSLIEVIEHVEMDHKKHFDVSQYWEDRYASGKSSGAGSYGRLARFKANFINHFVEQNNIQSVLELGCGDGAQLALAEYPQYVGLDISPTAVERCRRMFAHDTSKIFDIYEPHSHVPGVASAELGLSLDVVYHLSNDSIYRAYLDHLFAASSRFVIIYSNTDAASRYGVNESATYIRFRDFLHDIAQWQSEWSLASATPNRFPYSSLNPENTSFADFFIFEKNHEGNARGSRSLDEVRFLSEKILNSLAVFDENAKQLSSDVRTIGRRYGGVERTLAELNKSIVSETQNGTIELHQKLDDLLKQFGNLNDAHELQLKITQQQRRALEQEAEMKQLQFQLEHLEAQLQDASAENHKLSKNLDEISAKYRAANAKYRTACQQIATLRASQVQRAGSGALSVSQPIVRAARRAIQLRGSKRSRYRSPKLRVTLLQGLRFLKWKTVVPLTTRLGVPYESVARIKLPQSVREALKHPNRTTIASPRMVTSADTPCDPKRSVEPFTPPSATAQEVSILGWPAPPENGRPLTLAVMDEFTQGCFGNDLRLLQPRPDNWYGLAKKFPPALVFIESAWKGNGGSWQYRVGTYNVKPGRELAQMMAWAGEEGIPTIFWNKEDPVHHEKFMEAAALADHIFTTDSDMVESYKRRTGNESVHALPFAAQPALHKPAPLAGRLRRTCFAGSWYGNRHAERGEAMKWLLNTAHRHGLDIFDRNYDNGTFPFPEQYQDGIRGSLPYLELCKEYRRYRTFINVNSVTDSPTMFSRRVFELMACGTPVVSTCARGIKEMFQSDAVWLVRNEAEANEAIQTLLNNEGEWRRRSLAGIREAFSRHTYAHRLNNIFEIIGLPERLVTEPRLLLLARATGQGELERLLAFAENQRYEQFQLLIDCASGISAERVPERVRLAAPGKLLEPTAGDDVDVHTGMGWIAPNHAYGEYYLQDLANAMAYQPDASGWAKAHGEDAFAFGAESSLAASIWRPGIFCERWLTAGDQRICDDSLYCADSEEFAFDQG